MAIVTQKIMTKQIEIKPVNKELTREKNQD